MRYDAAIIGAGAEGLAAAVILARAGHKTIVIERHDRVGGRLAPHEFHPGFRASPFADEIAPIPADIHWAFDLSRRGAIFVPAAVSLAVWPDREDVLRRADPAIRHLSAEAANRASQIRARATDEIGRKPRRWFFERRAPPPPWPGEDWMTQSLAELAARETGNADRAAHVSAAALMGRAADPFLAASSLQLLAPGAGGSGIVIGGFARLADALAAAARDAGAEIFLGVEAADIRHKGDRAAGIGLADGKEIEARAVISTLDLRRTVLTFFQWNALPKAVVQAAGRFRMSGSTARVLLALDRMPELPHRAAARHVAPDLAAIASAYAAWRSGAIAADLPAVVRIVSAADPGLAPVGAATVSVTFGAVPYRLFDGAWTLEKRDALKARALVALEAAMPGAGAHVVGAQVIAPPDIEDALGATEGDLLGGELAPDQFLGSGPWPDHPLPRTPIRGLYLTGSWLAMGASATCAAGVATARVAIADLARGARGR